MLQYLTDLGGAVATDVTEVFTHLTSIGWFNPKSRHPEERYPGLPRWLCCCDNTWDYFSRVGAAPDIDVSDVYKITRREDWFKIYLKDARHRDWSGRTTFQRLVEYDMITPWVKEKILAEYGDSVPQSIVVPPNVPIVYPSGELERAESCRYYWARGNVKRALLALFCSMRLMGFHSHKDIRWLIGQQLLRTVTKQNAQAWTTWADGEWRFEAETWNGDRERQIALERIAMLGADIACLDTLTDEDVIRCALRMERRSKFFRAM
jgi:hypothetical protein